MFPELSSKDFLIMRKISAAFIFPISSAPIKHGIVSLQEDGQVNELIDTSGQPTEISSLEYYNGILVPGFLNFLREPPITIPAISLEVHRLIFERGIRAVISAGDENTSSNHFQISLRNFEQRNLKISEPENNNLEIINSLKILNTSEVPLGESFEDKNEKKQPVLLWVDSVVRDFFYSLNSTADIWYVISEETLRQNTKKNLRSFFAKNYRQVLFSWNSKEYQELITLFDYFINAPRGVSIQEVVLPATYNPARLINQIGFMGEICAGSNPGINLIEGIDFRKMQFGTGGIKIKRLA